jgi:CheY-like chemotaxis protein
MPDNHAKPKVLVVDDERVIADTLAMILNQSGFQARAVYSGETALETAATFEPDMLITDVIMADLNGIDAAIQIRTILPRIKILLFSGQAALPICSKRPAPRATSSRFWQSRCIRKTC